MEKGLRGLDIKAEYRTKLTNVPKEFIVPLLERAISYKRAVGFFSSSALLELSKGIGSLVEKRGSIQLIASPNLSEKDVEAIEKGYKARQEIVENALIRSLPQIDDLSVEDMDRYNLLAFLIQQGFLDIRIAIVDDSDGIGIYHEKLAIVEDAQGDKVVFTGSMNESKTGMVDNYGAIDVFKSWCDPEGRIPLKEAAFSAIWDGREQGIATFDFQVVKDVIVRRYLKHDPNVKIDRVPPKVRPLDVPIGPFGRPTLPDWVVEDEKHPYQRIAVSKWADQGYQGLFDMATGTGKTITALMALTKLFDDSYGNLAVIITCPQQHLVEQWLNDLDGFGIKPIVAYSNSRQRDWRRRLKEAVFDRKLGLEGTNFFCCITTNATFASKYVQDACDKLKGNLLLIADEAHNLGAPSYLPLLDDRFDYRLALTATFARHHDREGTEGLRAFFGADCINYTLEMAIRAGVLSQYKYYPVPVYLTEDELAEYSQLTRELGKCVTHSSSGEVMLSQRGEIIAQKRARVIAAAENKIAALRRQIEPYRDQRFILVYCGAASLLSASGETPIVRGVDERDARQISCVVDMLGNELGMRVSKFTSEENVREREVLKREFAEGNLQALVAIKCLDEGVNIPSIRTAFMLASTTNPKEHIQRRGRLLRTSPGKEFAEIYDFIVLPYSPAQASGQTLDEVRGVFSLIKNETDRGFEFARFAMNFTDAQSVIDTIVQSYRLDELKFLLDSTQKER